ncbi:MAG: NAD(P)H-hydrate dehydratase [Leptospirales bacterium]|nr:NAD(P)H-hydrate dehydratase [Leptospirales bacterium]
MIIKAVTSDEMREIDRISIEEIGMPAEVLMNNAGKSVAEFIIEKFSDKKISILCGTGNNGGDGFTAAYYLFNEGIIPDVYFAGKKDQLSDTSKIFMNLCGNVKIPIHEIDSSNLSAIAPGDIIVDAILGTGLNSPAKGIQLELIKVINNSGSTVISIDIPSGLGSNGELLAGDCVKADFTITIGLPKISLVTYPCRDFCGEVIIQDIGFPYHLTNSQNLKNSLINESLFNTIKISDADKDIHKGDRGHSLIIGGFQNMEGAAILTGSALFHAGCGLATIATTDESRQIIAGKIPEIMTFPIPDSCDVSAMKGLIHDKKITSLIIGPGLGRTEYSDSVFKSTISAIKESAVKRALIDGDGLFLLAEFIKNEQLPQGIDFIITPHFMEASRLLGRDIEEIRGNRLNTCIELSNRVGAVAVLKGPATIVSDGERAFINTTGNSGLATAGSGDVLSGIIGSFMNFNIPSVEAAIAGVYIHGLCADLYKETYPSMTMKSSDIVAEIRHVMALLGV